MWHSWSVRSICRPPSSFTSGHLTMKYSACLLVAAVGRLMTRDTVLLLCDMQEKFRTNIVYFGSIVSNAARLLQVRAFVPHVPVNKFKK